jgi:hypothetical protein
MRHRIFLPGCRPLVSTPGEYGWNVSCSFLSCSNHPSTVGEPKANTVQGRVKSDFDLDRGNQEYRGMSRSGSFPWTCDLPPRNVKSTVTLSEQTKCPSLDQLYAGFPLLMVLGFWGACFRSGSDLSIVLGPSVTLLFVALW